MKFRRLVDSITKIGLIMFAANEVAAYSNGSLYASTSPYTVIGAKDENLLQISKSNSKGQSVNLISYAEISGRNIKLINTAALNKHQLESAEASTIVLDLSLTTTQPDLISLSNHISLVGKTAELVLLTNKNNRVICDGCSFDGFSRIVIATGSPNVSGANVIDSINIGKSISNSNSGSITVAGSGLRARGTTFLDFASNTFSLKSGEITTNLLGKSNGTELTVSGTGEQEIATGNIRLYTGDGKYDLDEGVILSSIPASWADITIDSGSQIKTGSFFAQSLYAKGTAKIHGDILTNASSTAVDFFKGRKVIPDGSITVKVLDKLVVTGSIAASGQVDIESGADLYINELPTITNQCSVSMHHFTPLHQNSSISGQTVNLVSLGDIYNYGVINGDSIFASGSSILNEGDIWANGNMFLEGISNVKNQFGGFISADSATLKSGGIVINGSNRPYRIFERTVTCITPRSGPIFETGTYHKLPDDPENSIAIGVPSFEATIIANNLEINSGNVRNINPYFVAHTDSTSDQALVLDASIRDGVVISAANNLSITASSTVTNSSSIMEAEFGKLAITAPDIVNERYRVQVNQGPADSTNLDLCNDITNCTESAKQAQYVYATSPAGRMYAGGNSIFNSTGSLLNDLSFIEIMGDLNVSVNSVTQNGFQLQSSVVLTESERHSKKVCSKKVLGKCIRKSRKYWTTYSSSLHTLSTGNIPALFSVEGFLIGKGAGNFTVSTLKVNFE